MRKILLPLSFLVLLALDMMALTAIRSGNNGLIMFGWVALLTSTVIYAIFALRFLSKDK